MTTDNKIDEAAASAHITNDSILPSKTLVPYSRRRNFGEFFVPYEWVDQNPGKVLDLLAGVLIVRAEHCYRRDGIEYAGVCDFFPEVPMGQEIPFYDLVASIDEEGYVELAFEID